MCSPSTQPSCCICCRNVATALLFRVRVDEAVENTDTPDTLWLRARGCGGERRRAAESE